LYERDGSKDGSDQEHWFRAEKELTIQDATCSFEDDEVTVRWWSRFELRPLPTVRLPLDGFSTSTVLVSISASSALILSLEDEARPDGIDSDFLRMVSLPVAVDATRVTCELDGGNLVLKLPARTDIEMSARTACA
jgi:hypothetical protein